jgi:broad specificity phosphatase PhoE
VRQIEDVFTVGQKVRPFASGHHVVRHGNTSLNSANKIRGWEDVPLDTTGHRQAAKLGNALKGKVDVIYSSDLKRAKQTADDIADTNRISFKVDKGLRPWDVGTFTGTDADKAAEVLERKARSAPNSPVDGGESFNSFKGRFLGTVQRIMSKERGKTVAFVTHHRGERLFAAWEAKGMPKDRSVDLKTFLNWEDGIRPSSSRKVGK